MKMTAPWPPLGQASRGGHGAGRRGHLWGCSPHPPPCPRPAPCPPGESPRSRGGRWPGMKSVTVAVPGVPAGRKGSGSGRREPRGRGVPPRRSPPAPHPPWTPSLLSHPVGRRSGWRPLVSGPLLPPPVVWSSSSSPPPPAPRPSLTLTWVWRRRGYDLQYRDKLSIIIV